MKPSEKKEVTVTVSLANVSLTGGYQVSGKLASLFPIQGDGLMSVTFFNVTAETVLSLQEGRHVKQNVPTETSYSTLPWTSSNLPAAKYNASGEENANATSRSSRMKRKDRGNWKGKKNNHLAIRVDSIDLEAVEMKIESNDHKNALHEGYNEEASDSNITSTSLVDHSNHTAHHSLHSFNSFSSPSFPSSNEATTSQNSTPFTNNEPSTHLAFESMLFWRLVHSLQQKVHHNILKCLQEVMGDDQ